jgi:hypothetical protein
MMQLPNDTIGLERSKNLHRLTNALIWVKIVLKYHHKRRACPFDTIMVLPLRRRALPEVREPSDEVPDADFLTEARRQTRAQVLTATAALSRSGKGRRYENFVGALSVGPVKAPQCLGPNLGFFNSNLEYC